MMPNAVASKIIIDKETEYCPQSSRDLAENVLDNLRSQDSHGPVIQDFCTLGLIFEQIYEAGVAEGLRLASDRLRKVVCGVTS